MRPTWTVLFVSFFFFNLSHSYTQGLVLISRPNIYLTRSGLLPNKASPGSSGRRRVSSRYGHPFGTTLPSDEHGRSLRGRGSAGLHIPDPNATSRVVFFARPRPGASVAGRLHLRWAGSTTAAEGVTHVTRVREKPAIAATLYTERRLHVSLSVFICTPRREPRVGGRGRGRFRCVGR